jgi:hypothetical protein
VFFCSVCDSLYEFDDVENLLHHIRLFHPDTDANPERWPDGEIVIYDEDANDTLLS